MTLRRLGVFGAVCASVLALGIPLAAAATVPLGNPGFEVPTVPVGSYANFPTGSTLGTCGLAMPGSPGYQFGCWRVFQGNVDVVNSKFWKGAGGSKQSIELNGTSQGDILQAFVAKPAFEYHVSFKLSGDPFKAETASVLVVYEQFDSGGNYISGAPLGTYNFDTTGITPANMGYVTESGSFQTATNAAYADIEFQSNTFDNSAPWWGPVIDNVVMHGRALPPT